MTPSPRPTEVERYVETENARTDAARLRRWLIMVASLLATFGCAPKPPPAQVIVTDRQAFRESIRTIAAVDIALPEELSAAPHGGRLNVLVLDVLNRTGFEVVRLDAEEWNRATDKVGGLFDPRTGEADPAKYDEAHALLVEAADAVANKPVDGIARPRLVVEVAGFANYNAMWSGAIQPPLTSGAAWSSFLGGVIVQGRIRALSIHLPIRARSGEMVFQSLAGL